jgi:hypothetical protein
MKNQFIASFLAITLCVSSGTTAMALSSEKQQSEALVKSSDLPIDLESYLIDKIEESTFNPEDFSLMINLDKTTANKKVGDKFKINADLNYDEYTPTFYSTNKKIATVSKDGKVTCKKSGDVKIVAECNGIKTSCKLTVKKKPVKKKKVVVEPEKTEITDSKMSEAASKIGWQTQYAYADSTIMCSAYSFAYAYYQVTGVMKPAGAFWTSAGCTWNGGTYRRLSSSAEMLSTIKSEIDNNKSCVGLLSTGSSSTHYVTFYGYTGDGTSLSDFKILDPWDGNLTTGAGYGYCSIGYHVATVNA